MHGKRNGTENEFRPLFKVRLTLIVTYDATEAEIIIVVVLYKVDDSPYETGVVKFIIKRNGGKRFEKKMFIIYFTK